MTKTKILIICLSVLMLIGAPRNVAANVNDREPSFQSSLTPGKHVSNSSLETALSNHGLDQVGHGLLILAIVSLLALRKR